MALKGSRVVAWAGLCIPVAVMLAGEWYIPIVGTRWSQIIDSACISVIAAYFFYLVIEAIPNYRLKKSPRPYVAAKIRGLEGSLSHIARQIAKANGLELPHSWEFNSSDLLRFAEGLTGDERAELIIAGKGWGTLRDYVQYEADHIKKLLGQLEALAPYLSGDMNLALQEIATGPFLHSARR